MHFASNKNKYSNKKLFANDVLWLICHYMYENELKKESMQVPLFEFWVLWTYFITHIPNTVPGLSFDFFLIIFSQWMTWMFFVCVCVPCIYCEIIW
jgi:hypothetical protein